MLALGGGIRDSAVAPSHDITGSRLMNPDTPRQRLAPPIPGGPGTPLRSDSPIRRWRPLREAGARPTGAGDLGEARVDGRQEGW